MPKISERTKKNLERSIGLSYEEIVNLSYDEEIKYIQDKNGKPITFSTTVDNRKRSRGNPLLALNRIRTIEYIDKRISKIK